MGYATRDLHIKILLKSVQSLTADGIHTSDNKHLIQLKFRRKITAFWNVIPCNLQTGTNVRKEGRFYVSVNTTHL
jgi:hypothetical protein